MRTAVLLALAGAVSAALRGPASYADQAADLRSVMEGVKGETEGGPVLAPVQGASQNAAQSSGFVLDEAALDDRLMRRGGQIQAELAHLDPAPEQTHKTAALSSIRAESNEERAARYFAAHGMSSVGHMLGVDKQ